MRSMWALPAAAVAAVLLLAHPAAGNSFPLRVESPSETDGSTWRVSGYTVRLGDQQVAEVAARAASARAPLDVHAVTMVLPRAANFSGVPFLRLFAHHCKAAEASGQSTLTIDGAFAENNATTPATALRGHDGVSPPAAPAGSPGGNVTLWCATVDLDLRLTIHSKGGAGAPGTPGGAGGDGVDGTPSTSVRCTERMGRLTRHCNVRSARMGALSSSGGAGGNGGAGGAGGVGGTVMMFTTFRMWHVHGDLQGGEAGAGGAAGAGGKAGAHFDEWQGESPCRCDWHSRRRGLRRRPPVFDGAAGTAGEGGQSGRGGYLLLAHPWALSPFVSPEQLRLTVRLFEAYAADALIASTGSSDGSRSTYGSAPVQAVLDSLLATNPRPLLQALIPREASAITDVATVRRARVAAGRSGLYGGGPAARLAPSAVTAAVPTALDYATDLAAVISRLNSLSALTGVLTQAAGVSIPAINWDSLRGDLSRRRMVLVQGADALEADMKAALGDAATRLVAAQEEKERKDALAAVDLVLGLLISGTGVIGESKAFGTVAKSTRDLTAKAIREFSKGIVDVKRYILRVRARSCTFDGILEILQRGMSIETWTGFPANADWSADLSTVNGTIVTAVQKAKLGSRHAELTSELACVFFAYRYRSQPRVEAAFNRFFIAAAARMDIIQQIMDIDVEQRRLTTEREGAQSQRRALASLRSDVRVQTSLGRASTTLLDQYEAARLATFRALSDLAGAYHLTSLADYEPLLANYGKQRLRANGVISPAVDATALRRLRADLLSAYHQSTRCHAGELPAVSHVWWDLTPKRHPAFFNTSLAAGVAKTFVLAAGDADCAGGGGTSPPSSRGAPPPDQAHCPLRRRTNARVVRLGVELLIERNGNGSTNSLPAYSGRPLPVVLHQMGVQSFRVNASAMATVPSRGLRMPLPDVPIPSDGGNGGGGDGGPPDTRQVCLRRGEVLSSERVRACPSPYATYMLVVGQASRDAAANAHLAAVTGVRIHAEVRSWSEGCTR